MSPYTCDVAGANNYDELNRMVRKIVDEDADTVGDTLEHFVYDGANLVLTLMDDEWNGGGSGESGGSGGGSEVTHRFLHGPVIDMVLAEEDGAGNVKWLLGDNQNTIRDVWLQCGIRRIRLVMDPGSRARTRRRSTRQGRAR